MVKKILIIGLICTILVIGYLLVTKASNETSNQPQQVATEQASQPEPELTPEPTKNEILQAKLKEVISKYPGYTVGVTVDDLGADSVTEINGDQEFIAASTTKVITATYTFDQAQKGKININSILSPTGTKSEDYQATSFRENVRKMIVNSDNEAWLDLMTYFGKSNIDQYTAELGYDSFTTYGNIISPNDMAGFLKQLKTEKLINADYTNELLGYMEQSWTGPLDINTEYEDIPKKTGWLEDRLHFVGILPDSNVSFSIYTETTLGQLYDYQEGTAMINDLLDVISAKD